MNFRQSIRWRIQAWHGAVLLAVVAACCVTTFRFQKTEAENHADSELDLRLNALTSHLGRNPQGPPPPRREGPPPEDGGAPIVQQQSGPPGEPPPPRSRDPLRPSPGQGHPPRRDEGPPSDVFETPEIKSLFAPGGDAPFYFYVWSRNGSPITKSDNPPDGVTRPVRDIQRPYLTKDFRTRGAFREAYAFTPPGECLLVGRSNKIVHREVQDFAWKLGALGMAVLTLGLAGGWMLASRAIRPISEISAAASRIAAGNLTERIQTSETESELGQLATVLDDTFKRLETAFAQQARFTSDAAHELRTPVSVILGQAQLALARERTVEEHRATIQACQRAAKRMHGLIESLLQLSVLDGSPHSLRRTHCDLANLGREHVEMMQPLADEHHIALESELAPASCAANPDAISQILINLLTNAMKFSTPGGVIRVTSENENGFAILRVKDTGCGISPEHLPHVFERFYRADASRNRTTGGAGLGLAICKSIAEAHGGSISVESVFNKGSTFTLRIPASLHAAATAAPALTA